MDVVSTYITKKKKKFANAIRLLQNKYFSSTQFLRAFILPKFVAFNTSNTPQILKNHNFKILIHKHLMDERK